MKAWAPFATALLLLPVAAWSQPASAPPDPGTRMEAIAAAKASAVKRMPFWAARFKLPVEERVGLASPELVEFLALDARAQGIPASPRIPRGHPGVLEDVRAVLAELPGTLRQRLAGHLAGVYLMEDFGGTGFTDIIRDDSGHEVAAFVILDPAVLEKRTANEWATWKEGSPFAADPGFSLRVRLEDVAHDTRRQAIEYILMHELGHVVSVGRDFHPGWNEDPAGAIPIGRYPFFDISWSFGHPAGYVNRFAAELPELPRVRYYFGARLGAAEMAPTYRHLEHTPFPTLYAATHFGDDFAESFANYVHVVMLKKPFEIAISKDGQVIERYGPCWDEPRCAAKRKILEDFLR